MKNYFVPYYTLTTLHYKTEMISSKKYLNFIYHNYRITYYFWESHKIHQHTKPETSINLAADM
jgi:hypothetical protein